MSSSSTAAAEVSARVGTASTAGRASACARSENRHWSLSTTLPRAGRQVGVGEG